MSSSPLIVLSISSREFSEYLLWRDMYVGLYDAGVMVVSIDTSVESIPVEDILGKADGLILGGGGDVDPSFYGGNRHHPSLSGVDTIRDLNEIKMLKYALGRRMPVLGICRGAQLINVAHGGTLFHDLSQEFGTQVRHQGREDRLDKAIHSVEVGADSRLAALLGAGGQVRVNSGHHQGIATVGEGLKVVARSADGLPEGIESAGESLVIGVQWHPENLWRTQDHASRLLAGFASWCAPRDVPGPQRRRGRAVRDPKLPTGDSHRASSTA